MLRLEVESVEKRVGAPQLRRADGRHRLSEVSSCQRHEHGERATRRCVLFHGGLHVRTQLAYAHELHAALGGPGPAA
jgi:hypothetical protein